MNKRFDSAKGWQGSNFLVGTGVGQNPGALVSLLQATFETPGEYTVQIEPLSPPPDAHVLGSVVWSTAGGQIHRRFDVGAGIQISGVADGASVSVQDNSGSANAAGIQYQVAAQIAKGLRPSSSVVTLYEFARTILAGGNVVVNIPQNAGVTSVQLGLSTNSNAAVPNVEALINSGGVLFRWRLPEIGEFVSIPTSSGTATLTLTNFSPATGAIVGIMWGIDG
jgi:hypothetical protein